MKQLIAIKSIEDKRRAIAIIEALPFEAPHEVNIREQNKDRTVYQNALMWKWYSIIGNELGETKEDLHERYKDKFLVNIYERDNPDYAEMVQSLRAVFKQGMKEEALNLRKRMIFLTSTTTATVKQLSEFLDNIERDAASLGIGLPHPGDQGQMP